MSLAFILTSLVIVATPGTGVLYTISAGLSGGSRRSLVAALGCTFGIVPHLVAAISGTAALLHAGGVAFEVVRFLGVGYLLFMAWSTWRDRSLLAADEPVEKKSAGRVIVSAILVNLLNPKLTLFFFAFLPQFLPAGGGGQLGRMLVLSAVFMTMTLAVFAAYGLFAAAVRDRVISHPRVVRRMRQLFAASFVALGAKLAATTR